MSTLVCANASVSSTLTVGGSFTINATGTTINSIATNAFSVGTALYISGNGNVGVIGTPASWNPSVSAIQIFAQGSNQRTGAFIHDNGYYGETAISTNAFWASGGTTWNYQSSNPATRYSQNGPTGAGTHAWYYAASGTANNAITWNESMRISNSGYVGIGTSPSCKFHVVSGNTFFQVDSGYYTSAQFGPRQANDGYCSVGFYANSTVSCKIDVQSGGINFFTNNMSFNAATIDNAGNIYSGPNGIIYLTPTHSDAAGAINNIGMYMSSTGRAVFHMNDGVGTADAFSLYTSTGGQGGSNMAKEVFRILSSGNVQNINNSYGAISDVTLKENIVDATPKLDDICKVQVRNFNFIDDTNKKKQIGVIAQELEQVFPDMVEADENGIKGVKYSVFVPMLLKAIQEIKLELDEAKAEIAVLQGASH